jgi:hypothetical protein
MDSRELRERNFALVCKKYNERTHSENHRRKLHKTLKHWYRVIKFIILNGRWVRRFGGDMYFGKGFVVIVNEVNPTCFKYDCNNEKFNNLRRLAKNL